MQVTFHGDLGPGTDATELDDDSIKVSGRSSEEQRHLVDLFVARHTP